MKVVGRPVHEAECRGNGVRETTERMGPRAR